MLFSTDSPLSEEFLARLKSECPGLPSGWSWIIQNNTALCSRFEPNGEKLTIKTIKFVNEHHLSFLLNGEPVRPAGVPSEITNMDLLEAVVKTFDAQKVCKGVAGDKSLLQVSKKFSFAMTKCEFIKSAKCLGVAKIGDVCRMCGKMQSYLKSRIATKPSTTTNQTKMQSLKRSNRILMKQSLVRKTFLMFLDIFYFLIFRNCIYSSY